MEKLERHNSKIQFSRIQLPLADVDMISVFFIFNTL